MRAVGVDLHKDQLVACFLEEDETHTVVRFPVTPAGLDAFRELLDADDRLAVEAGGNVWFFLSRVRDGVAELVVVDPRRFAPVAQSKKKTDVGDALALARALRAGYLPAVPVPDGPILVLRQLFAARETLRKTQTQYKNMLHAALARNGLAATHADLKSGVGRRRLAALALPESDRAIVDLAIRQMDAAERELLDLELLIIRTGKDLPGLRTVLQVRGLGLVLAIGLLAEIGDIAWFPDARHLASYAGLGVTVRQSNRTERRGGISKQGRRRLRTALIQAVLGLVKGQPDHPLAAFYWRKKREKGAGKAICATARKLLTVLYVLLTTGAQYRYLEPSLYARKLKQLAKAV